MRLTNYPLVRVFLSRRMDCRIKSGNDEINLLSRGEMSRYGRRRICKAHYD